MVTYRRGHLPQTTPQLPAMQMLTLCIITASNLPYTELFLSRGLKEESISRYGHWTTLPTMSSQLSPQSSPQYQHPLFDSYSYPSAMKDALVIFQRFALLRRLALWTVTHGVHLYGPVVGHGGKSLDTTSPSPYPVHRGSSTYLLRSISASYLPTSHGVRTLGRRC